MLLADTFSSCCDSLLKFSPSAYKALCSDSNASILFRLFLTAVSASSFLEDISEACNELHSEINELNPQTVSFCLVPELLTTLFQALFPFQCTKYSLTNYVVFANSLSSPALTLCHIKRRTGQAGNVCIMHQCGTFA
jgi:hypothetical protein